MSSSYLFCCIIRYIKFTNKQLFTNKDYFYLLHYFSLNSIKTIKNNFIAKITYNHCNNKPQENAYTEIIKQLLIQKKIKVLQIQRC